jgi:enoyl-CoA hydratase/carnithine racemase
MEYSTVLYEIRDGLAVITLNRPDRMNAINHQMMYDLVEAMLEANQDPNVGAIVWTGAGRAFCAGADIARFEAGPGEGRTTPMPRAEWVSLVLSSKPIVCAVNGPSIGAGLTRTLACDARVASTSATFSMRFIRLGLVPELGSTYFLPQIVGLQAAAEMSLSGRTIEAAEALALGLVYKVVEPEDLLPTALTMACSFADNPPGALLAVKRLLRENAVEKDIHTAMLREGEAFRRCQMTAEHREAVAAFREKRRPDFRGLAKQ